MINFNKVAKAKAAATVPRLDTLFEQLDRKASHNSLRPVQSEALAALNTQIAQRDIVLKVSTGSGKTLVGLVYGEYMRRHYAGHPVCYLVPTQQLVDQVLQTAAQIGVTAESFGNTGRPLQAFEGRSILVCTYDRLFNARSVLVRDNILPSAIVLDDVHSGVERIRQKYTAVLPADLYQQVRALFATAGEGCDPAVWRGIVNNEAEARFDVPYWLWLPQCQAVAQLIEHRITDDDEQSFSWGNISRYIEYARLCISGVAAELSLPVPATEENTSYAQAKHRLFMSASIKDGSALLRDLGCEPAALDRVIHPESDKGAGERMVLPISLIDPAVSKQQIAALCANLSAEANVVVLTSSNRQGKAWEDAGAELKSGAAVEPAVAALRATWPGQYYVFAQRFDGVDLPDDACRVLVVDGTPLGERLCDQIDSERQKNTPGYNTRTVNRLEQALGRAVRSSADYAAVLLVGSDLAAFIGRRDVKDLLEPHTREQIELGRDVADQLRQAKGNPLDGIETAVHALLERDSEWKDAHRDRMATVERAARAKNGLTLNEQGALAERIAWEHAKANNHQGAVQALQGIVNEVNLHDIQRSELQARMACYMHRFDAGRAAELYRKAFSLNSLLPRPPQMPDRRYTKIRQQAINLNLALQAFATPSAVVARLEELKASLAYAGAAESIEKALKELGDLLGAAASRPEKETGRGPDVLWIFDDVCLCIEAKSEKTAPIFKSDAEQLLLSMAWCVEHVEMQRDAVVPVFATDVNKVDRVEDVSFGPLLLSERTLVQLIERFKSMISGLSFDGPLFRDVAELNRKLSECGLSGKQIVQACERIVD